LDRKAAPQVLQRADRRVGPHSARGDRNLDRVRILSRPV
jgi:hypothetical protein